MRFEDIYASTQNSSFRYENVYNRLYRQLEQKAQTESFCVTLPELTQIFFEAGVKAALGERTQQPILLKGKIK